MINSAAGQHRLPRHVEAGMTSESDMTSALLRIDTGHDDPWRPTHHAQAAPPPRGLRVLSWYAHYAARRAFTGVRLSRQSVLPPRNDRPLVVYLNHSSWWDPLLAVMLTERLFHNKHHVAPVTRAVLRRFHWFGNVGMTALDSAGWSGARAQARAALAALEAPDAVLWLAAPVESADPRQRPTPLPPLLPHLARRCDHIGIIPLALEYPFWESRRPEALIRIGRPIFPHELPVASVRHWTERLKQAMHETQDSLAAQARRQNPGDFAPLVEQRRRGRRRPVANNAVVKHEM